jgi:uncharacterized protein YecT (DUF1311 family)
MLRELMHYDDTQADMNVDAGNDFETVDKELNRVYKEMLKSEDTVAQNRLKEAQRAWLKYRDAQMLAFYPYKDSADHWYGTVFPVCWSTSLASLEQIRLEELTEWKKNTSEEGDICSGAYAMANVANAFQRTRKKDYRKQ